MAQSTFRIVGLPAELAITDGVGEPALRSSVVERRVQTLWDREQMRRGRALSNGPLFSLMGEDAEEQVPSGTLSGHFVEYRFFVAQQQDPSLYQDLRVRPLAVTGVMRTRDKIVFGRRAGDVTQEPGLWELMPSGGIGPDARAENGRIDATAQLLRELEEEVNVPPNAVAAIMPRFLLIDKITHVHDIVCELRLVPNAGEIADAFERRAVMEYSEMRLVELDRLQDFLRNAAVAPSSLRIAEAFASSEHAQLWPEERIR